MLNNQSASCFHLILLQRIIEYLDIPCKSGSLPYALTQWFDSQCRIASPVIQLSIHGGTSLYLVVTPPTFTSIVRQRVAVCSIRVFGTLRILKCNSVYCEKGKNKAVHNIRNIESDACLHLSLLMKHITAVDGGNNSSTGASDITSEAEFEAGELESGDNDEDDDDEHDSVDSSLDDAVATTESVSWSEVDCKWVPGIHCSNSPIPISPNEAMTKWADHRKQGLDITRKDGLFQHNDDGTLTGVPAAPSSCQNQSCGVSFHSDDSKTIDQGFMKLHTNLGTIRRKVIQMQCLKCNFITSWNPACECIHVVNHGQEGGEIFVVT